MPTTKLDEFSNDDLFYIINCEKQKKLAQHFHQKNIDIKQLMIALQKKHKPPAKNNKISQSLLTALTDAPNYPLVMLWYVIGLISLGLFSLTIITACVALLMLGVGGLYFYSTYCELKKEARKVDKEERLTLLKSASADVLINNLAEQLNQYQIHLPSLQLAANNSFSFKNKDRHIRIKQAVGTTLFVALTLFSTYFIGCNAIIAAFGLAAVASAMTGPIGIGVAIALCAGVGLYFGYRHYQANKNAAIQKQQQKVLSHDVRKKSNYCIKLQTEVQKLNAIAEPEKPNEEIKIEKPVKNWKYYLSKKKNKMPAFSKNSLLLVNNLQPKLKAVAPTRYRNKPAFHS